MSEQKNVYTKQELNNQTQLKVTLKVLKRFRGF